jgi:predicted amidohydrolase
MLPLSSAMDDSELDNGGDGDGGGGGGLAAAAADGSCGRRRRRGWWWRGRSMAVGAWQRSTAAMDYGEAVAIGRCNSTVAVAGGDRD